MITQNMGEPTVDAFKKIASVAFAKNDVVAFNDDGFLIKATATTPRSKIAGLIQEDVVATDADYAQNTFKSVLLVNCEEIEFKATVDTGSAVQSMVGKYFDLNDHNGINVTKNLQKAFKVTKVISATEVLGTFNTVGNGFELVSYQQTITRAEFTDGGGTSGTKDLNVSIPAGAVFLRSMISDITGFIGDTSAVAVIGDGTDADRYNTGTPSIFADAPAGADVGAPSGTLFHSTAKTPKVTVTSGADFTNVSTGEITVTLFWFQAS